MKNYAIIADATCDLSKEICEKHDIKVVKGIITLPDKSQIEAPLEWDRFDRVGFYNNLKKNPDGYSTAPANPAVFKQVFKEAYDEGKDILCMTISGTMSGANGFAAIAKKEIEAEIPDIKINLIDSMRFGPGFGLMVLYAAQKCDEGKSLEETTQYIEENKNRFHQAGWLDDLSFVAKKGRLTHAKAFFGTLAGVKPIGEFDYNGMTTVLGKAKGAKAAYDVLIKYIEATIENPKEQHIFIAQTNRYAQAEAYKKLIEEKFSPKSVTICDVFPSNGINVGPGLMAAYYVGKPISKDLAEEKALIEKFLG